MNFIVSLIIQYKYLALFPLAAFEGPIVSLVAGFLVYLGYLQFIPSFIILIMGDIVPDTIYYYIGRFGNRKKVIEKYGLRFSIISNNFKLVENLWRGHPKKTMFLSKLAYGLSTPFLISAGLVDMPFKRFFSYALPVTIFQYAIIMIIGYFLGQSYQLAARYIEDTGIIIAVILIIFVGGYIFVSNYARKRIIKMEQEEIK